VSSRAVKSVQHSVSYSLLCVLTCLLGSHVSITPAVYPYRPMPCTSFFGLPMIPSARACMAPNRARLGLAGDPC
jgi:hypothetical protein